MWTDTVILGNVCPAEKSIPHTWIEGQPKGNSALKDSELIKAMTAHATELGHLKGREAQAGLNTHQAVPQPMPGN